MRRDVVCWVCAARFPTGCHPEQSEGSGFVPAPAETQIPRFARNDKFILTNDKFIFDE